MGGIEKWWVIKDAKAWIGLGKVKKKCTIN